MGFSDVFVLVGGYDHWIRSAFPTETKPAFKLACANCHIEATPDVVADWQKSKHAKHEVTCSVCHGTEHSSEKDVDRVADLTPYTCARCHQNQGTEFKGGKHASAWNAVKAWPNAHWQAMVPIEGTAGCQRCHKLGIKNKAEAKASKRKIGGVGFVSCDVCHTRHAFSLNEARRPQTCRACHSGSANPQWEMYSRSRHGWQRLDSQAGRTAPTRSRRMPACQDCHMPNGHHGVQTAWGFLAVRLPLPDDEKWAQSVRTILGALGILDKQGRATSRMTTAGRMALLRLSTADWQSERRRMLKRCCHCHPKAYAQRELENGDRMVREADGLMAEAIQIVAGLYADKILASPVEGGESYPDLLTLYEAGTPLERRLSEMFFKSRRNAVQGMFHNNTEYAFESGLDALHRDLGAIKYMAEQLRDRRQTSLE
jgi:hypothetical protein